MAKVRLLADVYTRPLDFENPKRDEDETLLKGAVFEVSDAEHDRLLYGHGDTPAAEDYTADDAKPDDSLRELASAQLDRMREERATMAERSDVKDSELKLQDARIAEAERTLARAEGKLGRSARSKQQAPQPPGTEKPAGGPDPDSAS